MRVIQKALTFDDVLLVPAHSTVLPREVRLETRLTRTITLNMPLLSAAMDTVTESRLAIALAQEGGIGVIHKNLPIEGQAAEVDRVKRSEAGMIVDPVTMRPTQSIRAALELMAHFKITGKDIQKMMQYPNACKDALGRLRAAAAIGSSGDFLERAAALVAAKVDVLFVDSSHAHSKGVIDAVRRIRERFADSRIVAGNV